MGIIQRSRKHAYISSDLGFSKPTFRFYRSQRSLLQLLVMALTLSLTTLSSANTLFTAEYEGKYSGMTIKSSRTLTEEPSGQYRLHSIIKNTFASIEENSVFTLNGTAIIPSHYHYKRKIMGFKADESIAFDWDSQLAKYRRKNKKEKDRDHKIFTGVLDPALYQLQLQRDLFSNNTELSYSFVKPSKIKTLNFKKTGKETLKVGNENYPAIKLERINLDDNKKTRIWLIPDLNYQIGRIEHIEENGDSYSIYLTKYSSSPSLKAKIYVK